MGYWIEVDLGGEDEANRLQKLVLFCLDNELMNINDVQSCLDSFLMIEAYEMCSVLQKIINDKKT